MTLNKSRLPCDALQFNSIGASEMWDGSSNGQDSCNRQRMRYLTWFLGWSLGVLLNGSVVLSQALALPGASATEFECVIEPQQVVKLASPVVGVIAPTLGRARCTTEDKRSSA